jgi:hypothetical protein
MSALGHSHRFLHMCSMSAIGPISDLQFGVANTEMGVIQAPEPGPRIVRYEHTDFERTAIRPFLPNKPRGVPGVNDRRVFDGIFPDIAVRRTMARSAGELQAVQDLLQPVRSLANNREQERLNFSRNPSPSSL